MSLHHLRRLLPASAADRAVARLPVLCVCARRCVARRPCRPPSWRRRLAVAPWRRRLAAAPWRRFGGGPLAGRHGPNPRPLTCFATGGYGRAESVRDAGGWRVPGLTLKNGVPLGIQIPGVPAVAAFDDVRRGPVKPDRRGPEAVALEALSSPASLTTHAPGLGPPVLARRGWPAGRRGMARHGTWLAPPPPPRVVRVRPCVRVLASASSRYSRDQTHCGGKT
mgnify:CR=1 FL=1